MQFKAHDIGDNVLIISKSKKGDGKNMALFKQNVNKIHDHVAELLKARAQQNSSMNSKSLIYAYYKYEKHIELNEIETLGILSTITKQCI